MTLPFGNSGKRKFQCFVCGLQFPTYDDFKEHVLEDHEEGREYLTCPKCQSPVRDLRTHFKVKHPKFSVPKDRQLRATVWYDFSSRRGQKKTKKPSFKEGYLVSTKNNGDVMHYRSGYELEVYECLEQLNEVCGYEVEPKDCQVPWYDTDKHKWRKYWPDIRVTFIDGSKELWEVKPANQTDQKVNREKWDACNEMCLRKGYTFKVKTEKGIQELRRMVLEQSKRMK